MSNQFLKLRRSAVPGRVPTTSSLDFGEIALNTYDGLAFMKKSGSSGEQIVTLGTGTSGGSSNITGSQFFLPVFNSTSSLITSSIFQSGSFTSIRGTTPLNPTNPDILFISGAGVNTYNLLSAHSNINSYAQINVRNFSAGLTASADIVATNNIGTEDSYYINMGINGDGYNIVDGIGDQNDAYLYSTGENLLIGNASEGKSVILFNGTGSAINNARVYINPGGTVGINTSDTNISNPESLLVEPLSNSQNNFNNLIVGRGTINENYLQLNITNLGTGSAASSDIVATNDIGDETSYYIDMGVNSSGFNTPNAVGTGSDAYLYSTARHLHIGNASNYPIQFFVGGLDSDANRKLQLNVNGKHELTGSLNATQGFTGSLYGTASWAQNALTSSISINAATASSADNFIVRNSLTASNALITGTITAQTLVVQTVTSSIVYSSGSNNFGSQLTDRQTFTGSVSITGSLTVNGNTAITSDVTASMSVASASFAQTASYVVNSISASYVSGSAAIITNLTSSNDASINGLRIGRGEGGDFRNVVLGTTGGPAGGANNTAVGYFSANVTIGNSNTAYGAQALLNNTIGTFNTAIGVSSLQANTGIGNTGVGINTLLNNATGSYNIAVGFRAGQYITGLAQNYSSSYSIYIGTDSKAFTNGGTNEIVIGYNAVGSGSNTVVIGNNDITNTHLKGSITTTGAFTGSLFGTASWAQNSITASYALTASYVANASSFPFTGSAVITGSLEVTGSTSLQVLNVRASQFNNTSSITVAGTTIVSSIVTGSFTSAFYNYTIASASNARSGQVMSVWNGTTIRYTEVTTTDVGNTATASFAVAISGPNVNLSLTAPGVWTVKSIANLL